MSYIKAIIAHWSDWFSFRCLRPFLDMSLHTQLNPTLIPEEVTVRSSFGQMTTNFIYKYHSFIYNIPILGGFLTYGFYITIAPVFLLLIVFKRKRGFFIIIPYILSILFGCLLSPIALSEGTRYTVPLVYTLPITIGWIFSKDFSNS